MENVFDKVPRIDCCGCSSCAFVCSKNAIKMEPDDHGFIHPVVDVGKCVGCGLCLKVCPEINFSLLKKNIVAVYGITNKCKEIKSQSTSGGLFSLLADYMLTLSGSIYGATYNCGKIEHIKVTSDYSSLRGSKYSQSNTNGIIESVIEDLKNGTYVLFTGTPCQCAGLKKLLDFKKIATDKILLVDFVCHGVVSPQVLRDYITYSEKTAGKNISVHKFRDKCCGWSTHIETNIFVDGTEDHESYESQLHKRIFLSHYGHREACFNCKFTTEERVADITMGDFWGLRNTHPELWNDEGISLAIVLTEKGQRTINQIKMNAEIFNASLEDTRQPQLKAPPLKPDGYDKFWKVYNNKGFNAIVVKYFHGGRMRRIVSDLIRRLS